METLSSNAAVAEPGQDSRTIREYLQERASNFEHSRNEVLKALETLPKVMLDLECEVLAKLGIYF